MKAPPLPTLLLLLLACGAARAASPPRHAPSPSHDAAGGGGDTPLECRVATPALTVCASSGSVLVNERARYTVEVPAGRSLACELVPVGRGDADLEVAPPAGGSARAKASREAYGADVVSFTAAEVSDAPSDAPWTVEVLGFGDDTEFDVRCEIGAPAPSTAPAHVAALRRVLADCCASPGACPALAASLKDAAAGGAGPCGSPPNECDNDGYVTSLSLAGDGLDCRFPASLADLGETVTSLDLTLNEMHGTWAADVAPVLKKLPNLSSLSLALNRLHGDLTCVDGGDDADSNGKLAVVAVTANALTGAIPACFVGGEMVELHASRNAFTALPDIKKGAAKHLRVLAVADQAGEGVTGEVPCLSCAPDLREVRLDGNALIGALPPALPPRLASLNLARTSLSGRIPSAWGDAVALEALALDGVDAQGGPLPPAVAALPSLRVLSAASASLGGPLPSEWGPSLVRVRLANNSLSGGVPAALGGLDGLALLDLADNQLSGDLSAFAAALDAHAAATGARTTMRYLNLGGNKLDGHVPSSLAAAGALAPGAWGAAPDGRLLKKTLNLTANAFTGPLPEWLVVALAHAKDVAVGLGGNDFSCPRARVRVARALPSSVAAGVECVREDGERTALEEVLEVEAGGGGRKEEEDEGTRFVNRDDDDDDDDDEEGDHRHKAGSKTSDVDGDVDDRRGGRAEEDEKENDDDDDDDERRHGDHPSDVDAASASASAAALPRSHAEPSSKLARPSVDEDVEAGRRARRDDAAAAAAAVAAAQRSTAAALAAHGGESGGVDPPPPSHAGHSAAAAVAAGLALAALAVAAFRARAALPAALSALLARARGYASPSAAAAAADMELVDVEADAFFQPDAALVPKLKPAAAAGGFALAARAGPSNEGGDGDAIGAYRPPGGEGV